MDCYKICIDIKMSLWRLCGVVKYRETIIREREQRKQANYTYSEIETWREREYIGEKS